MAKKTIQDVEVKGLKVLARVDYNVPLNEDGSISDVVTTEGYTIKVADYLGDGFTGYYYVSIDPYAYLVNYALWSETPIEYPWQYSESDIEWLSENGAQLGCYPLAS